MQRVSARGDIRVLVADDDAETRALLRAYLELEGYVVVEACDGDEALRALGDGTNPSAAILDIQMPGCDGLTALRAIKQRAPGLPVVIITGSPDPREVRDAYARGAVRVLRKPVALGDLGLVLERVMTTRRSA